MAFLCKQDCFPSLKDKKTEENKLMPPSVCFCLQFASMTASQRRASTISFLTCELLPFYSLPPSLIHPIASSSFSSAMLCCRSPSYSSTSLPWCFTFRHYFQSSLPSSSFLFSFSFFLLQSFPFPLSLSS